MIGRGSFGIVLRCVLIETGEVFAAKGKSEFKKKVEGQTTNFIHSDIGALQKGYYCFRYVKICHKRKSNLITP